MKKFDYENDVFNRSFGMMWDVWDEVVIIAIDAVYR